MAVEKQRILTDQKEQASTRADALRGLGISPRGRGVEVTASVTSLVTPGPREAFSAQREALRAAGRR